MNDTETAIPSLGKAVRILEEIRICGHNTHRPTPREQAITILSIRLANSSEKVCKNQKKSAEEKDISFDRHRKRINTGVSENSENRNSDEESSHVVGKSSDS